MHRTILAIAILLASHLAVAAVAETNPFLEAGTPAATRVWSGPDYERTLAVLIDGKVPLPRLADPQGAALLQRMTSPENLSLQRDKSLLLSVRLVDFCRFSREPAGCSVSTPAPRTAVTGRSWRASWPSSSTPPRRESI
jgi:hypothetical protein